MDFQIEGTVDKSARVLSEWRAAEAKAKKTSHAAARENEKLQDAMLDVRYLLFCFLLLLDHLIHTSFILYFVRKSMEKFIILFLL